MTTLRQRQSICRVGSDDKARTHPVSPLSHKTVCYVSVSAFGGVWRTYKQAMSVTEAGAKAVFVSPAGHMPEVYRAAGFDCREVDARLRASEHPVWLVRVALNLTFHRVRNRIFRRYGNRALVRAVAATGADVVQATGLTSLEVAHEAARRLGAKLVYDGNELWAGFLKNPDMAADREWAERLLAMKRRLLPRADLVLAVSDLMADRLAERYPIRRPLVIHNAPPDRVTDVRPVSVPVRLVFHGGLSHDRNIDGLIRAMVHLRGRATLDIHGFERTARAADLKSLIDELGLQDAVTVHGEFEYPEIVRLLSRYDVGVMANGVLEENFEIALPNKVFDCMCAGLAVAMTGAPAMRALIEETGCGITLDPSSPETIARDLGALVDDPGRIMLMKEAAVRAAPRYWWPEQGRKLVAALEGVLRSE